MQPGASPDAGRLIAIEGVDGAGKTTQATRLAAAIGAHLTREPGGTVLGERIRELLLDHGTGELADRTELLLVLSARAQHLAERIEPLLGTGEHVVVDRFSGSTVAYQGYGRGLPVDEVRAACDIATAGRWPDLNILLDVPVDLGAMRRSGVADRIEAEVGGFQMRVRDGYRGQASADPVSWCTLDGSQDEEVVAAELLTEVAARLGIRPVAAL